MDAFITVSLLSLMNYGEVVDNQPTYGQRALHTYTNIVRVDPMAWQDEYPCNTNSWTADERTPKAPLHYHIGLTEIAQLHSVDLERTDTFSHDSSDGTSFSERVWPYYEGNTIGENIAAGYSDSWAAVVDGWMCSDGHRENIMAADFEDLGAGVEAKYYTQDFGGGANTGPYPVAMGVHAPKKPSAQVTFYATWSDTAAPTSLAVETPEACLQMSQLSGESDQGAWSLETDSDSGCVAYRFYYETASGSTGSLPTNGSYQYGEGCALWVSDTSGLCDPEAPPKKPGDTGGLTDTGEAEWQRPPLNNDANQTTGCACSVTVQPSHAWTMLLFAVPVLLRRRTG